MDSEPTLLAGLLAETTVRTPELASAAVVVSPVRSPAIARAQQAADRTIVLPHSPLPTLDSSDIGAYISKYDFSMVSHAPRVQ
jgi:hypothetical protein